MWITKLKLRHDDCPIVNRCQKFNILVFSYPATHYNKKGKSFATTVCYFQSSDEEKKKKFLSNLKKDAKISNMESSGDVFSYDSPFAALFAVMLWMELFCIVLA